MNVLKDQRRSDCPINFTLEILGDSWSLLIIRDIIFVGKKTFGEFLASDEGIARNILSSRLAKLEAIGILRKTVHPEDKRKDLYLLTDKGLDLIPILLDLAAWGAKHEPQTAAAQAWLSDVKLERQELIQLIYDTVKRGGSVFGGEDSVVVKLGG